MQLKAIGEVVTLWDCPSCNNSMASGGNKLDTICICAYRLSPIMVEKEKLG